MRSRQSMLNTHEFRIVVGIISTYCNFELPKQGRALIIYKLVAAHATVSRVFQLKSGVLIHKLIEQFVESKKVQGILVVISTHVPQHVVDVKSNG